MVPADLQVAPVPTARHGSILGFPQTLNPGDTIVAFGAVATTRDVAFRAKFHMALYDSDDTGSPRSLLVSTDSAEYSNGSSMLAADGLVEKKLSRPYVLTAATPRTYWIMLWVASTDDLNLLALLLTVPGTPAPEVRAIQTQDAWPSGSDWTSSFDLVPPPAYTVGFFPHMFVKYVPGKVR